jgi:hypothetical protein
MHRRRPTRRTHARTPNRLLYGANQTLTEGTDARPLPPNSADSGEPACRSTRTVASAPVLRGAELERAARVSAAIAGDWRAREPRANLRTHRAGRKSARVLHQLARRARADPHRAARRATRPRAHLRRTPAGLCRLRGRRPHDRGVHMGAQATRRQNRTAHPALHHRRTRTHHPRTARRTPLQPAGTPGQATHDYRSHRPPQPRLRCREPLTPVLPRDCRLVLLGSDPGGVPHASRGARPQRLHPAEPDSPHHAPALLLVPQSQAAHPRRAL